MPRGASVERRILYFLLALLLAGAILTGRFAWLQLVQGQQLKAKAAVQLRDTKALQSPRGTIFDRNGRELAISSLSKSLYANPQELDKDAGVLAEMLSPILGMKAADIKERLRADARFIWIKRTLDKEQAEKVSRLIKEQQLKGFGFIEESKRYYPNDTLAAHVLGFVGTDDAGLDGVEMVLDKTIKGELSQQIVETDSYGVPIYKSIFTFLPRKEGKSVLLTIDNTIQFIVEQSLDRVMARTKARSATAIVINPRTGEILAMANRPAYNPNRFFDYGPAEWKNRAVSIIYEPGSTFKAIVAAAALQEGVVRPEERFQDNGYVEVSGRRIKNWDGGSYGNIAFVDIIKNSINTGFVQVGMRLGASRLNDYARAFGFGKATDVELPGEEEGLLFETANMRASDLATMSIGQSIAVTPLQLLSAVAALANDGVLLKPHIIKEIRNPDGSVVSSVATQPVRQVVSAETARIMTGMLEKVVTEGGGKKAAVKGYRFAGKTGTAEKLRSGGGGYEAGKYIASFVGYGPVDDVQVAALVIIDDPSGVYYGGEVAAPVFSEIMTQVMRYLNIKPLPGFEPIAAPRPQDKPAAETVGAASPPPPGKVVVPNVLGKTIREAADSLNKLGLAINPAGTGIAVKQSIPANTVVDRGAEVTVWFEGR
ncbi:MAG: transpeptidase family protein [Negativicutes bacterium]|nr:transpeptidase family protein [Negativicutes bacterium]